MADAPLHVTSDASDKQPPLPVRRLQNFIYCPRLFYYQWVENIFEDNADTVEGTLVHRNADVPSRIKSYEDMDLPEGATIRSLKLESEILGIIGAIDIVENVGAGIEIVDYKKGSARRNGEGKRCPKEADAMQVIAYALILSEHNMQATQGWIYYAAERRRVPVSLDARAFEDCRSKIREAKSLALSGKCPPPLENDPRCLYCSAYPICLPNESFWWKKTRSDIPQAQLSFDCIPTQTDQIQSRLLETIEFAAGIEMPDIEPPRPDNDEREILVVQTPGAMVGIRGGQLTVIRGKEILAKAPMQQVRSIYCYGAVQISAQAISTCLEHCIEVAWFSAAGRYLGCLTGLPTSGIDARRGQYRLFDFPHARLHLAREIIRTKIRNQRVMLMRNADLPDRPIKIMAQHRDAASRAVNIDELLGIEGAAAAIYFEHFKSMIRGKESWSFDWNGRNRRPPKDPINALLSLGYSMLAKELTGVCHSVGLDPFLGFLHQPRYGRPALALDLMEEFRPLVADSVAISLMNRNEVGISDFINSSSGTFLNQHGRKAFWEAWFRRMDTPVKHPQFGYKMSYRRMFEVQARQIWRFARGEVPAYHGFYTR